MLWRLIPGLFLGLLPLTGSVLTDNLGTAKRVTLETITPADSKVWEEYGLAEAETGRYEGPAGAPLTATAWRMKDPTGAQAVFRWLKPANAKPGNKDALNYAPDFAVTSGNQILMGFGNYVIRFEGRAPTLEELKIFLFQLPKVDQSSLPPLLGYVPKSAVVAGTDRFVSGPASLEKFYPKLSPSAAGFHFGAEAFIARYKVGAREVEMAIFYYPTNQMARDRQPEFQKVPGAMVKRAGPLLAIVISPPSPDDAERVLSLVDYKAQVTINQASGGGIVHDAGEMLVAIFQLTGVLLALTVVGGVMLFGMRRLRRKAGGGQDEDPMTMLHLEDR